MPHENRRDGEKDVRCMTFAVSVDVSRGSLTLNALMAQMFSVVFSHAFSRIAQEPGLKLAHAHRLEGLPLASSAEPVSAILNFIKSPSVVLWVFKSLANLRRFWEGERCRILQSSVCVVFL